MPTIGAFKAQNELGAIVGKATIVGCQWNQSVLVAGDQGRHVWRMDGQYGFELENIEAFDVAVPWKGMLGFFDVPDDAFAKALREARAQRDARP